MEAALLKPSALNVVLAQRAISWHAGAPGAVLDILLARLSANASNFSLHGAQHGLTAQQQMQHGSVHASTMPTTQLHGQQMRFTA